MNLHLCGTADALLGGPLPERDGAPPIQEGLAAESPQGRA